MQLLILGIVAIAVFVLEEYVFTASRHFWVGGIVPVLWTILLAYLVLVNAMNLTVREYALAIIAVIIPYVCWGNGYQRHQQGRRS